MVFDLPTMDFTSGEIIHLRRLWSSLRLFKTETVKPDQIKSHNRPLSSCKTTRNTKTIDDIKADAFIKMWSTHVVDMETPRFSESSSLLDKSDAVITKFQLVSMFKLLTFMLDNLTQPSITSMDVLVQVSKVNARIWNLEESAYILVGEALTSTILDILGRNVFTTEIEIIWLRFYSTVASSLVYYAKDPASTFVPETHPHVHKLSISEQSTITSRLSLSHSRDDSSSFTSVEQSSIATYTMGTSKPTVIDEDSDEDTSYDLLNSFVPETTNISKSKSAKKIKKNKYGPTKGKPPALVGWNHPKKQSDDCVIS
ncbi:hypothetical protein PGUG_05278 [Meyerozyma guilliermondii ATCC 6260]|uniref:Globin family profile domain-containing protein n=1 Tax=Meyerozyma guilliermondii (strain ATCC 6260 / CBS 566 / DSM 6381 / JCM 1539 / NBRC 10279 / NRRL Y-324) TaxID=294746 RepID=A5DPS7_PICGU|nr:uncharacterized protein PGUG_05278 [Meyerozyma guilliermondii ATCC 6260]EDK41180.2 hypothetical protein PGUG_05278 [Meyerozyma guilliermondii ATCC 6260]